MERAAGAMPLNLSLLLLLWAVTDARAATIFVSSTPPNSNDPAICGTSATPCASIGAGVAAAAQGDTLSISGGTYSEAGVTIKKELTLIGDESDVPIYSCNSTGGGVGFTISDSAVTMETLQLTGCRLAISTTATTTQKLVLKNCRLSNNVGDGAVQASGVNVEITGGTFSQNTVTQQDATSLSNAAGVTVSEGALTASDVTFDGNTVSATECVLGAGGGALRVKDGNVLLSQCSFTANTVNAKCGGGGGAIVVEADKSNVNVIMTDCEFTSNTVTITAGQSPHTGFGGAVWTLAATQVQLSAFITRSTFNDNGITTTNFFVAAPIPVGGGDLALTDTTATLEDVVSTSAFLAGGSASGGSIFGVSSSTSTTTQFTLDSVSVTDVSLTGQCAPCAGGGIYVAGSYTSASNVTVSKAVMTDELVGKGGGCFGGGMAVCSDRFLLKVLNVNGCSVPSQLAAAQNSNDDDDDDDDSVVFRGGGGGLFLGGTSQSSIGSSGVGGSLEGAVISGNQGGAVMVGYTSSTFQLSATGLQMEDNTADLGGAFMVHSAAITLLSVSESLIRRNSAMYGAVFFVTNAVNAQASRLSLGRTRVSGNTALAGGSMLALSTMVSRNVSISQSDVTASDNTASYQTKDGFASFPSSLSSLSCPSKFELKSEFQVSLQLVDGFGTKVEGDAVFSQGPRYSTNNQTLRVSTRFVECLPANNSLSNYSSKATPFDPSSGLIKLTYALSFLGNASDRSTLQFVLQSDLYPEPATTTSCSGTIECSGGKIEFNAATDLPFCVPNNYDWIVYTACALAVVMLVVLLALGAAFYLRNKGAVDAYHRKMRMMQEYYSNVRQRMAARAENDARDHSAYDSDEDREGNDDVEIGGRYNAVSDDEGEEQDEDQKRPHRVYRSLSTAE